MTYYVYILTNKNKNVLYVGVTNDLIRRVYEHKHHADKESYTSKYNVVNLVYYEETSDVKAAIEREKTDEKLEQNEEIHADQGEKSNNGGSIFFLAILNEIAASLRSSQ